MYEPIAKNVSTGTDATKPARDSVPQEAAAPTKRGFKPRWLRLKRRERKLKEARATGLVRA